MKPRLRIKASGEIVRQPARPQRQTASLFVRMNIRRNTRKRTVRNALLWTTLTHLIGLFILFYFIKPAALPFDDIIHVEMVTISEKREIIKQPPIKQPPKMKSLTTINTSVTEHLVDTTVKMQTEAATSEAPEAIDTDLAASGSLQVPTLTTAAELKPTGDITPGTTIRATGIGGTGGERTGGKGTGGKGTGGKGAGSIGKGRFVDGGQGTTGKDGATHTPSGDLVAKVDKDRLGAVLEGNAYEISGHIRIIRLKHSLSDWWQDPTAIPSFAKWLQEHTQLRADMTYAGGALTLTDDRILNAPLVIMTGHDKDIAVGRNLDKEDGPLAGGFTRAELAQLRKYIVEREGMLFFDDCGFNGNFAALVQNELQRAFPEYPLRNIDHTHEIYTVYYHLPGPPDGGDVFWGNLNTGDSGGYFPGESQFRFQKGITINRRLAVLYNRKDYMCSMETAEVGSRALLSMRRSNKVHRFMTNLLIYQMRYGGNTDRSNFNQ